MASQKPSTPKGTRDFSPDEMMRRNFIFDTIRSVFKKYGYQPIETPAMENLDTLTGKYGEEGDKLIYKVRSNKNLLDHHPELLDCIEKSNYVGRWIPMKSDKALRYDLTVPFARFVVQHQATINFPFKRYQIQPVWRADNPQRGRYREFYQCDADVIGSKSLLNEIELVQMIDEVFGVFEVPVLIKINNRKVLTGIAELIGTPERMLDIAIAMDKLDKIGWDGVKKELLDRAFTDQQYFELHSLMVAQSVSDVNPGNKFERSMQRLTFMKHDSRFKKSEVLQKGINELLFVFMSLQESGLKNAEIEFDFTLARGLNYYTGAIFEVKAQKGTLRSSICGGGRYDDLTGMFGLPNMSGVGISFGIDRIFDVLNEVEYPHGALANQGTRVLFANFGGDDERYSLKMLKQVRDAGIAAEIYLDAVKMGKQFKYADDKKIPFVAIVGENERMTNSITLKNMQSGEQFAVGFAELLEKIK